MSNDKLTTEYGCACRWIADKGQVKECGTHAGMRAEIERLRNTQAEIGRQFLSVVDNMRAEIERLREQAALRAYGEAFHSPGCPHADMAVANCCEGNDAALAGLENLRRAEKAEAEIKRLTADQQDWARRWKLNDVTPWDWMTRAERAEADAKRLAAALSGFRTAHREEPVDAECLSGIGRCSLCIAADTALAAHEEATHDA